MAVGLSTNFNKSTVSLRISGWRHEKSPEMRSQAFKKNMHRLQLQHFHPIVVPQIPGQEVPAAIGHHPVM
ncbi:MAG: hypothetical protein Q9190_006482 [Brigantiaea leucoxantha]